MQPEGYDGRVLIYWYRGREIFFDVVMKASSLICFHVG